MPGGFPGAGASGPSPNAGASSSSGPRVEEVD